MNDLDQAQVVRSTFSTYFSRIVSIRREANRFEDALRRYFSAPTVLGIPDEVAAELPRLIMTSPHGHSRVEIAQSSLALHTQYDGEFRVNFELCKAYLLERIKCFMPALQDLSQEGLSYSGLVLSLEFDNGGNNQPVATLADTLLKPVLPRTTSDVGLKMTFERKSVFYLNLFIHNYREHSRDLATAPHAKASRQGIAVQVDVNDRLAFNSNANYRSSETVVEELMSQADAALKKTVPTLMRNGEISL